MRKFQTIVLAAGMLLTAGTPVFAQADIQEPGMFAFYHPDRDVLNGGARTPEYHLEPRVRAKRSYYAIGRAGASYCGQRYRSYDPATDTFVSKNGERLRCE
jgi:hypothetical protein